MFSNPKCIAVLKDEATLVTDDRTPAALDKAGLAHSIVSLQAKLRNGNFSSYRADLAGFVDPSRRVTGSSAAAFSVFGWDDVFVPLSTGESLHARRAAGSKVSNRDAVVSDFLHEHVHYARLKDLSHAAALTHPREAVDFSIDPAEFVARHPLLSKGLVVPGFGGVLRAVINGGLFFRAADSRRTGNYWWPGLNAGRTCRGRACSTGGMTQERAPSRPPQCPSWPRGTTSTRRRSWHTVGVGTWVRRYVRQPSYFCSLHRLRPLPHS